MQKKWNLYLKIYKLNESKLEINLYSFKKSPITYKI